MDRGLRTLVFVVAVVVAACGSAGGSPSGHAAKATARVATPKPLPTIAIANGLSVKGAGSASSSSATLKGDYILSTSIRTKKGCGWSVRLQGLAKPVLDSGSAKGGGTHRLTVKALGVEQGSYRLVVKTSKCGTWSAVLKRP
jgi:hypothetical protein